MILKQFLSWTFFLLRVVRCTPTSIEPLGTAAADASPIRIAQRAAAVTTCHPSIPMSTWTIIPTGPSPLPSGHYSYYINYGDCNSLAATNGEPAWAAFCGGESSVPATCNYTAPGSIWMTQNIHTEGRSPNAVLGIFHWWPTPGGSMMSGYALASYTLPATGTPSLIQVTPFVSNSMPGPKSTKSTESTKLTASTPPWTAIVDKTTKPTQGNGWTIQYSAHAPTTIPTLEPDFSVKCLITYPFMLSGVTRSTACDMGSAGKLHITQWLGQSTGSTTTARIAHIWGSDPGMAASISVSYSGTHTSFQPTPTTSSGT